ncbi:MAG: 30S ribosomal protein S6 [Chloroflexi bacterium]|nr:30S ribosomal protein S6 [Chloroflexota bacterium]MCL5276101.1 30S ribosomal protein S6 [Chloroflexota bacterium]
MTRSYELTFIVKPDVDAANFAVLLEKVKEIITAEGGSITRLDQWGMRRLMYPIRKYREGQYVFALAQLEALSIGRIENRLRLTEDIIRYLLIRADETATAAAPTVMPQAEAATPEASSTAEPESTSETAAP